MSVFGVTAENAQNNEDIERHWAMKAFQHAEVYFNLISSVPSSKINLTKHDDELYTAFRADFKDLDINSIDEMKDFKTEEKKKQWRALIEKYEHLVEDFNFGTLLRNRAAEDYVTRIQFLFIEIARNKEGSNQSLYREGFKPVRTEEHEEMEKELEELKEKIVSQLK
ncbi:hypothetical protein HK103_003948 [Boothiomyces macroporosus]|uniref:Polysaccharide biosynthesis domain-containing protein n=1 Tax=Boothiomyces macroporosus TaxID=261099 RepID=A0AAD5Y6E8_9FUNG|nr:hypothetical protein HK103_003948 [Boothiomyces macroporosus]